MIAIVALNVIALQSVSYGSAFVVGTRIIPFIVPDHSWVCIGQEYIDNVTLSNGLVIEKQSFGSAQFSQGFAEVDGVLGCVQTFTSMRFSDHSLVGSDLSI